MRRKGWLLLALTAVSAFPAAALAQSAGGANLPLLVGQGAGGTSYSVPVQTLLFFTALSFIPAALVCMTCFVRIVVVLSMLRHAIGLMESPPNVVIITLALFLTLFSMQPVLQRLNDEALQPYLNGQLKVASAASKGAEPLKDFMVRQTREQDLALMIELAHAERPQSLADVSMLHLIPAFMLSELRTAFQIGFVIFLPFLLIDLIVASVLMALGMMMVPPSTVSVPLKLLLFVLIDGWNIVTRSLLGTIH